MNVPPSVEYKKRVMAFDRKNYNDETLLNLYKAILLPRMIEEKMLRAMKKKEETEVNQIRKIKEKFFIVFMRRWIWLR